MAMIVNGVYICICKALLNETSYYIMLENSWLNKFFKFNISIILLYDLAFGQWICIH